MVSSDGGETWEPAGHGIAEPMADMVKLFLIAPDGSIWAICAAGRLLHAEPEEWHWRSVFAPAATNIRVQSVSFVITGDITYASASGCEQFGFSRAYFHGDLYSVFTNENETSHK